MTDNSEIVDLFVHLRNDKRNSRATEILESSTDLWVHLIVVPIQRSGGEQASDPFMPISFDASFFDDSIEEAPRTIAPNLNNSYLGIYTSEQEARRACAKGQAMLESTSAEIMVQSLKLRDAFAKIGSSPLQVCVDFGGGNKLFLPASLMNAYAEQIASTFLSFDRPSPVVRKIMDDLDVDVIYAGTIDSYLKPFYGIVDISLSRENPGDRESPILIEAREVPGKPVIDVLKSVLANQCGLLARSLTDFSSPKFSGMLLNLEPLKPLPLGPIARS